MKPILLFLSLFFTVSTLELKAEPNPSNSSLSALQKQIYILFTRTDVSFPDIPEQDVQIGFMINARNEIIVLDINGDSGPACAYVKQVLNYQKVKFTQARQLTRYNITIHLMNNGVQP